MRGRSRRAWLAGAITAIQVALSGCAPVGQGDHFRTTAPVAGADEEARQGCRSLQRTVPGCAVVTVDGRIHRYALIRREPGPVAAVLDVGGPGLAVLGAGFPQDLVSDLAPHNVLLIDEPWTTAPDLPGCDEALTAWYSAMRSSWPKPDQVAVDAALATVLDACQVLTERPTWGFTPTAYLRVVRAIAREQHLRLTEFYGFSFASARWAYLGELIPRSVLTSPFPVGMPAERYLAARLGVRQPEVAAGLVGAAVADRAHPLSLLDRDAARLESLYLPPRARRQVLSGPDAPAIVGRLSDELFGRYGIDSISHAVLAYWQETCPALTGWRAVDTTRFGLPGQLLRICQLAADRGWRPATTLPTRPPTCVAEARGDGIVTAPMSRWLMRRYGWRVRHWVRGGHATSVGLTRCLVSDPPSAT